MGLFIQLVVAKRETKLRQHSNTGLSLETCKTPQIHLSPLLTFYMVFDKLLILIRLGIAREGVYKM